jgi:hypothetical protein
MNTAISIYRMTLGYNVVVPDNGLCDGGVCSVLLVASLFVLHSGLTENKHFSFH